LNTIKSVDVPTDVSTPKAQGFIFQIVTPQRIYSLLATSEEDQNGWVVKLKDAVAKVPPKVDEEIPLSPRERERRAKKEKAEEDKKKKEKEKEEKKEKEKEKATKKEEHKKEELLKKEESMNKRRNTKNSTIDKPVVKENEKKRTRSAH